MLSAFFYEAIRNDKFLSIRFISLQVSDLHAQLPCFITRHDSP
jgi:hypothetical protein